MSSFDEIDAIIRRVTKTEPDRRKAVEQIRAFLTPEMLEAIVSDAIESWLGGRISDARGEMKREFRQNACRLSREGMTATIAGLAEKDPDWFLPNGKRLTAGTYEDLRHEADRLGCQALGAAISAVFYSRLLAKMKPGQTVGEVWTPKQLAKEYARTIEQTKSLAPSPERTAPLQHPKGILLGASEDEGKEPRQDAP